MALSSGKEPSLDEAAAELSKAHPMSAGHSHPRIRRRNRMITSCLECRRRKLKCDRLHPCTNCSKNARDCLFLAPALDSLSQMKWTEIKEKMDSLERVLEHDVARNLQSKAVEPRERRMSTIDLHQPDSSSDEGGPDDERDLEPTPLAAIDAAYEDDNNDDMLDLGVKIGKMRLTERLGGFVRPKMSEELSKTLSDPSKDRRTVEEKASVQPMSPDTAESFLEPGPTYIPPGSGFIFGDVGHRRSLMDFLPSKSAADTLIDHYKRNVHTIAKVVHWPSFQIQYDFFWTNVLTGLEPTPSLQAIIFAVMFSAIASMSKEDVSTAFAQTKRMVLTNFQTGTEMALGKAQFLRTTKIETLQALVIYLIPMCRSEMSRAHSVLVGTAIRLGECMGLHRDPGLNYSLPPLECHVRRTLWFQLCFLDFRTSESQGPRPGVRREDYDTLYPLNINDADFALADPKETDTAWTDMTFTRIRFECNEMHRIIWHDRLRLAKKQTSITHVLGKIESFRKKMETKYHSMFNMSNPLQLHARLAMSVLTLRMHIMVLHPYHTNATTTMPDRLRQIILTSGTEQMENAIKLETLPELAPWHWYCSTYQQWATAFLLLIEVYSFPKRKEADRIWDITDYVFEPDRSLSREQKARLILGDLRDRIAIYRDIRKLRTPTSMKNQMPAAIPKSVAGNSESMTPITTQQHSSVILQSSVVNGKTAPDTQPSPNSQVADTPSPHQSAKNEAGSWSFDYPATFLARPSYAKDQHRLSPGYAPRQYADSSSTANTLAGVSSPSDASNSDSWPPFISSEQETWNMTIPSNQNSAQHQSTAMNTISTSGLVGFGLAIPDAPMTTDFATKSQTSNIAQEDPMVLDIDWNEWDAIFPPHLNTGILNMD